MAYSKKIYPDLNDIRRYQLDHTEAIKVLILKLRKKYPEFKVANFGGYGLDSEEKKEKNKLHLDWDGAKPDIIVEKLSGNLIIIEVGNVDAEKITFYLDQPKVEEIQWFDRFGILVGSWEKEEPKGKNKAIKFLDFPRDALILKDQKIRKLQKMIVRLDALRKDILI